MQARCLKTVDRYTRNIDDALPARTHASYGNPAELSGETGVIPNLSENFLKSIQPDRF
jgi:hypothetical protein